MPEPTNSKVPHIRFKRFEGEWEEKTLGDLGRVAMNKRVFKHQTSETGEVPFYKIGTFGKAPDSFISRKLFIEYKSKFSYPSEGDLLISASGSIGRIVEYRGKDEYFQDLGMHITPVAPICCGFGHAECGMVAVRSPRPAVGV